MIEPHPDLDGVLRGHLQRWQLRTDGPVRVGGHSLVIPVLTEQNTAAILKVGRLDTPGEHEHLVLRRWAGNGAARLLRADPPTRTVLLERLRAPTLAALSDTDACAIVADLHTRLHVPAMPQLPSLIDQVAQWTDELDRLPRSAPIPHRLAEQAAGLGRELAAEPGRRPGAVLHGDLHYGNVLATDRGAWAAISPQPLNGDPSFELAPMLWHRWTEIVPEVREGIRRRFWMLVDATGLDEDRARAATLIRVMFAATRELLSGNQLSADRLTRYVAIAKAIQD